MNWIDIAITGGSEAAVSPSVLAGFSAMKALSTIENANDAVIPFGNQRKGFLPGEGAACLILERENQAEGRIQKPLAIISGTALLNEAGHMTNPDPEAFIASEVIIRAISNAGLQKQDIDLVYAHGTGTIHGDFAEYTAYKNCWGNDLAHLPVVCTKHNTGHLLGASASLEAAMAVQMLRKQTLIPGHKDAGNAKDMQQPALFIPHAGVEMKLKHVLNYAAGFGGQQSAVILSAP
jgi:3-oxoacyl-[acyl-carrier-protein] synthase II